MLITKNVNVTITNRNITYYKNKGYMCKSGDVINIPVQDLNENCKTLVAVECSNCKKQKSIKYSSYIKRGFSNSITNFYYCYDCSKEKERMLADIKQVNGKLKRGDRYYWCYKENILKELKKYINKYNNVNNIKQHDMELSCAIYNARYKLNDLIQELDYNYQDLHCTKPYGYYNDKDNVVKEIENFIKNYERFPSINEMRKELSLSDTTINKHFDSINDLKKYINYYDESDLIDNRGDINRSLYELYVANYFVAQGLKDNYKREQYPFKNFDKSINYRSDFTFYLENEIEIHIEVWGVLKDTDFVSLSGYNKIKKEKKKLYEQYSEKIILINVEPNVFNTTYEGIEENLYNIFKNILQLRFDKVDYAQLIPLNSYSEDDILNLIMQYSKNDSTLPSVNDLKKDDFGKSLHYIVHKKYGGLNYFADKFCKEMKYRKNNYWNDEKVFEVFDYMLEKYGKIITYSSYQKERIDDFRLKGVFNYTQRNGSTTYYYILYSKYRINNNKTIPNSIIQAISKKMKTKNTTKEQQLLAKELLEKIESNHTTCAIV